MMRPHRILSASYGVAIGCLFGITMIAFLIPYAYFVVWLGHSPTFQLWLGAITACSAVLGLVVYWHFDRELDLAFQGWRTGL